MTRDEFQATPVGRRLSEAHHIVVAQGGLSPAKLFLGKVQEYAGLETRPAFFRDLMPELLTSEPFQTRMLTWINTFFPEEK